MDARRAAGWRSPTCRPRARSARASSSRSTTSLLRERGRTARPGAPHLPRHARAHALPQRPPDARSGCSSGTSSRSSTRTTRRRPHEISFGDNDFLAAQVAVLLGAERLVLLTNTDGLYTDNPVAQTPTREAHHRGHRLRGARGADDHRGDLRARVGRDAVEGRGGRDGERRRASPRRSAAAWRPACWRGCWPATTHGTRFAPLPERTSSFKLWLKYAKPSHGTVVVDAGAARALRDGGTSLLPVGIVEVRGGVRRRRRRRRRRATARDRQGDRRTSRPTSCAGSRGCRAPRCASCSPRPARKRCTGTTSSSRKVLSRWPSRPPAVTELLRRREARRARSWPSSTAARRTRRCYAIADALEARVDEILEANALDMEAGASVADRRAPRPAAPRRGARRDDRRAGPRHRRAARSGRRGHRRLAAGQRARAAARPRAARRRRRRLRGAAERHDRRRRAVPEVGQRDRAARVLVAPRTPTRCSRAIAAEASGLPEGAVTLLGGGREELAELATQNGLVDLVIPRGGEGLKKALEAVATVPVIYAASGNCHVFVDASADLDAAHDIVVNAKIQRPGVCNAAETLLVHADVAPQLPAAGARVARAPRASSCGSTAAPGRSPATATATPRRPTRTGTPSTSRSILAVKVVDSVEEAIEHVNAHGSGHSEAIVTGDVGGRPRVPARRRRRVRLRERLDALHRRRRVRDGRRDRQLDPEAPRPRADRPARAVHVQVPRGGRRARPGVRTGADRDPRRHVQPAAPRPPRHGAGGLRAARARRRSC